VKSASSRPISNTQRAVNELRTLIMRGELPAGSNHLEAELAERFGMSRTPIREAALILEGAGLLKMQQRKGIRILPISARDMGEVYDVLTELESLAAEDAARQSYGEAELALMSQLVEEMETALQRDDLEAWADADDRFHIELVRLGGNSRVLAIVGMVRDQVCRVRSMTLYLRPIPTESNEDHRKVLDAIRRGDPAEARRVHRSHRSRAKNMLMGLLEKHRLSRM
jgi:DNA-binding GntR family transcriptional regulator